MPKTTGLSTSFPRFATVTLFIDAQQKVRR